MTLLLTYYLEKYGPINFIEDMIEYHMVVHTEYDSNSSFGENAHDNSTLTKLDACKPK